MLIAIAAMASNRIIGKDNTLPRDIPEDLKKFKELTLWHTVIMGRKTYESLPENSRPLLGRHNIILSSQKKYNPTTEKKEATVEVMNTWEECLNRYKDHHNEDVYVIGWSQIYNFFLSYYDQLYITEIKWDYHGDSYFPEFKNQFQEISRTKHDTHDFVIYKKRSISL